MSNSHIPIGEAYMHRRLSEFSSQPKKNCCLSKRLGQFGTVSTAFLPFQCQCVQKSGRCNIWCKKWSKTPGQNCHSKAHGGTGCITTFQMFSDFNLTKRISSTSLSSLRIEQRLQYLLPRVVLPVPNPSHSWAALQSPWSPGLPLREQHRLPRNCWQLLLRPVWHRHDLRSQLDHWIRTLAAENPGALSNKRLWQRG